jgi:peptidoglycan hydrolase-like protein with peptidoglycan-binding domain
MKCGARLLTRIETEREITMTAISSARSVSSFAAASSPSLSQGASGSAVTNLQNKLRAAGYAIDVDGQFGPQTKNAVLAFQRARGLDVDGVVGPQTWGALNAQSSSSGTTLQLGASGAQVTDLQNKLRAAGLGIAADGEFGPQTRNAVIAFQRSKGLTVDGIVGPQTWAALNQVQAGPTTGPTLISGSSGGAVSELQTRLRAAGYSVDVDGQFGLQTKAAVIAFQRAKGLDADGVVGPKTWAAIGGASIQNTPVAGVSGNQALANAAVNAAMGMGGYSSQGLCATGVSRAIRAVYGFTVWGNGNQIDDNLPRDKFKQIDIPLSQALQIPGLVLTWERTSTSAGSIYGHTAITLGDGHSSASDYIENNTLAAEGGRYGLKIFMPI